jgi:aspartate kinase
MTFKKIISKFGGTSMGSAQAMLRSAKVAYDQKSSVVLVSATSGTTNMLVALCEHSQSPDWRQCESLLFDIKQKHFAIASELDASIEVRANLTELLSELETICKGVHLLGECSEKAQDRIHSMGERMSSLLFSQALKNVFQLQGLQKEIVLFDIRNVMITDDHFTSARPLVKEIKSKAKEFMPLQENLVYVSQGYIGKTLSGHTTTLGRGGSDYSASLIGEALEADVIEIWTDVAGIATTDPRLCPKAKLIDRLSYAEASEMAQYGAKVLHPTTLVPAMRAGIAVFVGSSFEPQKPGTWITSQVENAPLVRAITKRSGQTLMSIKTPEMLNAFGFLAKIFDIFRQHEISVDSVTTSEICVAVTVDQKVMKNQKFLSDLRAHSQIEIEENLSLISLIGTGLGHSIGLSSRLFSSIKNLNVRMICLGASDHNFNFLVKDSDADQAIINLHEQFVEKEH